MRYVETQTLIDVLELMADAEQSTRRELLQEAAARLRDQEKRIGQLREHLRCADAQIRQYMDGQW